MLGFGSRVCFAGFGFLGRWLLRACLRTFLVDVWLLVCLSVVYCLLRV